MTYKLMAARRNPADVRWLKMMFIMHSTDAEELKAMIEALHNEVKP